MIPTPAYSALAETLTARGTLLMTDATAYRAAHELPGWYAIFAPVTPASRWLAGPPGRVPDTATLAAFVAEQEDYLAGGIVLRTFESFGAGDRRAAEARVWWLDGEPVLVGAHPDTPEDYPLPVLNRVAACVAQLGARFVTTDLALREDGVWRVVEVGDGQVSDLPAGFEPESIIGPLLAAPAR
ncbi:ATP-grasp domain-containing protein [Nocardia jinanensis]